MIVGTAVRARALAVRQGAPRPSFEMMLACVSEALNRAVIGSCHRGAFLRDPKRVVMLHDAWYSGASGLPAAMAKARVCLRTLEAAKVWEDVELCREEAVAVPAGPEAFVHEGWPIYAGPAWCTAPMTGAW